jgi:hypothetical protein
LPVLFQIIELGISVCLQALLFLHFPESSESLDSIQDESLLLNGKLTVLAHRVEHDHPLLLK